MVIEPWAAALLALLGGYLLGSIPFGLLLTRAAGAGDLRAIGSGNIGATNVLRTGRKGLAAATLVLDALKGAAAVLIAAHFDPMWGPLAATGAFFGHLYPVWLRLRGGKGVAVMIGIALALHWPSGIAFMLVWAAAVAITRFSSVGGMAGAIATPVVAAWDGEFALVLLFLAFALMLVWKHRANLDRLISGTEPKVGAGGAAEPLG